LGAGFAAVALSAAAAFPDAGLAALETAAFLGLAVAGAAEEADGLAVEALPAAGALAEAGAAFLGLAVSVTAAFLVVPLLAVAFTSDMLFPLMENAVAMNLAGITAPRRQT
jgi:hypothetical protein